MKILILNVHSSLNLGDDAIMTVTLGSLFEKFPEAEIVIAANDPQSWSRYSSVQVKILPSICTWIADCKFGIWRKGIFQAFITTLELICVVVIFRIGKYKIHWKSSKKFELINSYFEADLVLSCAGGNFYATRPISPGFLWNLISLAIAIGLKKKIVMLPQSIGPIEGRFQRRLSNWIFKNIDTILLREEFSKKYILESIGLNLDLKILPDLAFGLYCSRLKTYHLKSCREGHLKIGVNIINRGAQNKKFNKQHLLEQYIISLLESIYRERDIHVFLFNQCTGPSEDQNDRIVSERIYSNLDGNIPVTLLPDFSSANIIQSAYAKMDIIIGTRMHTGIFAFNNKIPILMISYQHKTNGLMKLFGLEDYCINIEDIINHDLFSLLNYQINNLESIRRIISENHKVIMSKIKDWLEYIP